MPTDDIVSGNLVAITRKNSLKYDKLGEVLKVGKSFPQYGENYANLEEDHCEVLFFDNNTLVLSMDSIEGMNARA